MELFFDLIFVALVGQIAHGLHTHPSIAALGIFFALFASIWWSWVNLTFAVNIMPELTRRQLTVIMLSAMFAVGAIAVAAPEATDNRAWLFAAGNVLLRLVLLVLWIWQRWNRTASRWRILVYNGATAVLWFASVFVPAPTNFVIWAIAIVLEVTMLISSMASWAGDVVQRINVEHLTERFGLLVIIVLGESVLSTVSALNEDWTWESGLTAVFGLVIASLLAWTFFMYSANAMQQGLEKLQRAGDSGGIRDTVGFLPFLLVAGVTVISGALAVAIAHPDEPLPVASSLSLGGGISLFYLTNALIALRFGRASRRAYAWAGPAVGLGVVLAGVGVVWDATATVIGAAIILSIIVTVTEIPTRLERLRAD
ncbi:low temperature requirement protein A [Glaciibacter sp. 2TAF33]|uniref:low temperature requirement protein A n=1 Tax=Glaciibacter sp. 2TAF33 TaxID=3233015 RepID=UPI003F936F94